MLFPLPLASRLGRFAMLAAVAIASHAEVRSETYAVDPVASHVRIHLGRAGLVGFLGHAHSIDAPIAEGRVVVVDGDPARSTVVLRFDAAALAVVPGTESAGDAARVDTRMRGPEVLDAPRHPLIAFTSTSVRAADAEIGARFRIVVAGALALRGGSFPLEIPVEVVRDGERLTARGDVALRLRDLGIAPPGVAGVVRVADRFHVEFEIRAAAQAGVGQEGPR